MCATCARELPAEFKKNPRRRAAKRTTKRRNLKKSLEEMTLSQLQLAALRAFPSSPTQLAIRTEINRRHARGEKTWLPPVKGKRAKRNPLLGIFGANPRARVVRELGRVVEVRYKRKDDGGLYFHKYSSKPRLLALSDGSIWIKGA